ncbi:MAG: biotin/lipoyl-binding protein, partial [Loktanella sp.]|nr:biotin/lipoyl-binding protein [Loktanella sp.]
MAEEHLKPVDGPTLDQTTPTVSENTAKPSPKKLILAGVAVAALGFISFEGLNYWTVGRFMETTDDAYVKADVTLISSRAQGYVAEVLVRSNDHVNAGDLLARLDDGDARNGLALAQSRFETAGEALTRIDAQIAAAQAIVAQTKADRDTAQAQLNSAQTNAT